MLYWRDVSFLQYWFFWCKKFAHSAAATLEDYKETLWCVVWPRVFKVGHIFSCYSNLSTAFYIFHGNHREGDFFLASKVSSQRAWQSLRRFVLLHGRASLSAIQHSPRETSYVKVVVVPFFNIIWGQYVGTSPGRVRVGWQLIGFDSLKSGKGLTIWWYQK